MNMLELVYSEVGLTVSSTEWINVKDGQVLKQHLITFQVC